MMKPLTLPRGETPQSAYELAMSSQSFFLAAQIALQFKLGGDKIRRAAKLAIRRYLDHGHPDMALNTMAIFGVQDRLAASNERCSLLPN
ncbi:MAG: hypothetical protein WCT10_03205 [Patescibacteria group bacterium]|jgi:hypothetical protein